MHIPETAEWLRALLLFTTTLAIGYAIPARSDYPCPGAEVGILEFVSLTANGVVQPNDLWDIEATLKAGDGEMTFISGTTDLDRIDEAWMLTGGR